jgi:hypothetical protein
MTTGPHLVDIPTIEEASPGSREASSLGRRGGGCLLGKQPESDGLLTSPRPPEPLVGPYRGAVDHWLEAGLRGALGLKCRVLWCCLL